MKIEQSFITDIKGILNAARSKAYSAINFFMVEAYWQIGKRIVEEEQKGEQRAEYGSGLISELSKRLTLELGKGFSMVNLKSFRKFYLTFSDPMIGQAASAISQGTDNQNNEIRQTLSALLAKENDPIFSSLRKELTWSHYQLIMRVENRSAREYYIRESANNNWSVRSLQRNINTFYYERILSSTNKQDALLQATRLEKQSPVDFIKDPYIFEFLNIAESHATNEQTLETTLIDNLKHFLLELGKGFSFVKRQYRINTETKSFSIDLVFYNYLLKCFILFDIKTGELSHRDVGQMDMYVRIFDDQQRVEGDSPTIGIILCTARDETIVKYSVLNGNEQLFATKYKLFLPTEEELIAEIEREKLVFEEKIKSQNLK